MSYRHTAVAAAINTLILVSACGTPLPAVTSAAATGTPLAGTTPAAPNTQPAVPEIAADLQGLDIDTFFEASYKKLLLRDPETITLCRGLGVVRRETGL